MKTSLSKLIILACFSIAFQDVNAQLHLDLQQELLEIRERDQRYRGNLNYILGNPAVMDSLAHVLNVSKQKLPAALWQEQERLDSTNLARVSQIIQEYGFPGISMVGEQASTGAWLVLQHAPKDTIGKYYPLVQKAANKGDFPKQNTAMMEDRLLMYNNKPQKYGTQSRGFILENGERLRVIWPILHPETVNQRRKAAGFKTTVEENAKRMGIDYQIYTIDELIEKTGNKVTQDNK